MNNQTKGEYPLNRELSEVIRLGQGLDFFSLNELKKRTGILHYEVFTWALNEFRSGRNKVWACCFPVRLHIPLTTKRKISGICARRVLHI